MNNLAVSKVVEELSMQAKEFILEHKEQFFKQYNNPCIEIDAGFLALTSPHLAEAFYSDVEKITNILEEALADILVWKKKRIRFVNISETNRREIHNIRAKDLQQIISVKGIIKRLTKVIIRTRIISYECTTCGAILRIPQPKRKIVYPARCTCGYKGASFTKLSQEISNIQELNLEEMQDELDGKQPQQLRVYLEEDLTDNDFAAKLQPGRKLEVIGVIQELPEFMTPKDEIQNISEFMMYANNIIPLESDDDLSITAEDELRIKEIAANNPLKYLSESLVPEVYGNDLVKKAIVLQTVKAVPKLRSDGSYSREDINILLCGDVGVAKSVSLKATVARTPKAKMVVGTKTSKVGLGAMAVKDELTNTWSLECGALVLCSGGLLAIDELDKMYKEHLNDLLEPMSGGTVTINKAGISATLPAKTSILASANPIYGNYDLAQPLAKQIDLPTPILNRFDLIFILLDRPNEEFDSQAVAHIFKGYKEKMETEIPTDLFKKYIIYCRKLRPTISPALVNYVQDFYVSLREKSRSRNDVKSIPVNLRNMEAIVKLAEANAKIRLSETVEVEDLNVAKEIFMFCLKQVGMDEDTGIVDWSRTSEKIPMSKRGKLDRFIQIINELAEINEEIFYSSIKDEAKKNGIKDYEANMFLDELSTKATIFQPRKGIYKLVK
jgi:replicative DNA helicase Mcm